MKFLVLALFTLALSSCAHHGNREVSNENDTAMAKGHQNLFGHSHKHGSDCGHESTNELGTTYYKHDGELHFAHGGHFDKK